MAKKHPNKDIRAALEYAEQKGWRIIEGGSHGISIYLAFSRYFDLVS